VKWEYDCLVTCLQRANLGLGGTWVTLSDPVGQFEVKLFFEKTDWTIGQTIKVFVEANT
jgi:hypothetical protein